MRDSIFVTIASILISVVIALLAAYSIVYFRYPGKRILGTSVLATYLIPPSILVIPLYGIIRGLGLINTRLALIVTFATILVPFSTWMLMSYLRTIPAELVDASRINELRANPDPLEDHGPRGDFFPGIVTAVLFAYVDAWDQFIYPLVFISSDVKQVLPGGHREPENRRYRVVGNHHERRSARVGSHHYSLHVHPTVRRQRIDRGRREGMNGLTEITVRLKRGSRGERRS